MCNGHFGIGKRISHCERGTVGWFHAAAAAAAKGAAAAAAAGKRSKERTTTKVLTHAAGLGRTRTHTGGRERESERGTLGWLTHETGLARLGGKGREVSARKK